MGKIIGIDLGTTLSVASFYENKNPGIVLNHEGGRLLPSVVAFTKNNERLIGEPAKSQLITNPKNTIYSIKRLMGKNFSEIKPYLHEYNLKIVEGSGDSIKIEINDILFSPEEISAMILQKLKESAEQFLNCSIEGAIITVPAYFNDSQRQATKNAGIIAGLNVLRIINEPTAAALAFSLDLKKKSNVVVYDFGGGTLDISILEVRNDIIKVLATSGDTNLGGNDLDRLLTNSIINEINNEYNIDLHDNQMAFQRILEASEIVKKELSTLNSCEINLPFIANSAEGPIHFFKNITRKEFENIIKDKVEKSINICDLALKKAGLHHEEIDEVLLVGGSTRIPLVQSNVKAYFKKDLNKKINPDEIVAIGAAIQGSIINGKTKDIILLDVTPISLGVKTMGGSFTRIIDSNTTTPTKRTLIFTTAEDNQSEVEIDIFQGEREIAEDNKLLGKFTLKNIPPALKGIPRIEVTFNINVNGILKVSAIDLSTKNKKEFFVSNSGLLDKSEIKKIKENAEIFRQADLERKELIKVKNNILKYIYLIEQSFKKKEFEPEKKLEITSLIKKAKIVLSNEILEELKQIELKLKEVNEKLKALTMTLHERDDTNNENK